MSRYEVVVVDWRPPNVIATFDTPGEAEAYAETMDRMALRCFVRRALPSPEEVAAEEVAKLGEPGPGW